MYSEYENKVISKIWITGGASLTLAIPHKFVKELGLVPHSYVVVEKKSSSELVIRKLEENL